MSRGPVSIKKEENENKQEPAGARGITAGYCGTSFGNTIVALATWDQLKKNFLPFAYARQKEHCMRQFRVVENDGTNVKTMEEAIKVCCLRYHGADGGKTRDMKTVDISDRLVGLTENENSKTAWKIIQTYEDAGKRCEFDFRGVLMSLDVDSSVPNGEEFLETSIVQAIRGIRNNATNEGGSPAKKLKVDEDEEDDEEDDGYD